MLTKIHKAPQQRIVISVCDKNLIGKVLVEKNSMLNLSLDYFKGEKIPDEKILEYTKICSSIHFIGEKSISFALNNNLIQNENIKTINKVPHCIRVMME